jgi:uncharacterized membrane protein
MADQATERIVIAAPLQRCWDEALDVERYPEWAGDIKQVTVHDRDDEGRATRVTFRAAAYGRSTTYTLGYDFSGAPNRLAWELLEGDVMKRLDGSYEFQAVDDDPTSTEVVYDLVVEMLIPLPGFVKRRAESKIMNTALRDLKSRVESSTT